MWGGAGTLGGEFALASLLLFATGALAVLGHFVLVVPVRANPALCVRRRFAHWLGCVGFLFGGAYWVFTWTTIHRGLLVNAVGGLVCGVVLGELIGAFVSLYLNGAGEEEGL